MGKTGRKRDTGHFSLQWRGSQIDLIYVRCFAPGIAKQRQSNQNQAVPEVLLPEHNERTRMPIFSILQPIGESWCRLTKIYRSGTLSRTQFSLPARLMECKHVQNSGAPGNRTSVVQLKPGDQLIGLQVSDFFFRT